MPRVKLRVEVYSPSKYRAWLRALSGHALPGLSLTTKPVATTSQNGGFVPGHRGFRTGTQRGGEFKAAGGNTIRGAAARNRATRRDGWRGDFLPRCAGRWSSKDLIPTGNALRASDPTQPPVLQRFATASSQQNPPAHSSGRISSHAIRYAQSQ